jgi:hypothetical protein
VAEKITADQELARLRDIEFHGKVDFQMHLDELDQTVRDKQAANQAKLADTARRANQAALEALGNEAVLRANMEKTRWSCVRKNLALQQLKTKAENFAAAFKTIQEQTGITDVNEMVNTFIEREQKNFSMFEHLNLLTRQLDTVNKSVEILRVSAVNGGGS